MSRMPPIGSQPRLTLKTMIRIRASQKPGTALPITESTRENWSNQARLLIAARIPSGMPIA